MSVVRMGSVTEAWQEHRNGENVANCGYVQYLHRSVANTVHCCRSMNGIDAVPTLCELNGHMESIVEMGKYILLSLTLPRHIQNIMYISLTSGQY